MILETGAIVRINALCRSILPYIEAKPSYIFDNLKYSQESKEYYGRVFHVEAPSCFDPKAPRLVTVEPLGNKVDAGISLNGGRRYFYDNEVEVISDEEELALIVLMYL